MRVNAAVVNAVRAPFSLEAMELEEPRDDEVFVRVMAAGMSRIDLLARDQEIQVALPAVLGCEGAGRVERVGAKVMSLAPSDRVIFAHGGGSPDLFGRQISRFREVEFAALRRPDQPIAASSFGHCCFATHVVTEERNLIKVPDDDTPFPVLAALGGDVQAGASAVINTLRPRPGSSIAIFGVGAAGLSAVIAARLVGCQPIIAIDIKASRLDLAEQLGATHTIESLVSGGTCILAGMGAADTEISLKLHLLLQRRVLIGNPFGASDPAGFVRQLCGLYRQGRFPIDRLITEFRFDDINDAADALLSGAAVKPVLIMP
jgi:aryl-alcohol dehydrogenase